MKTNQFRIGRLANLGQVIKALGKTIRAMSDGSLDGQLGSRLCSGLSIMRACFETQKLEELETRLDEVVGRIDRPRDEISDRIARAREHALHVVKQAANEANRHTH